MLEEQVTKFQIYGITYIKNDKELTIGDFVNCTIVKFKEYDLIAKI